MSGISRGIMYIKYKNRPSSVVVWDWLTLFYFSLWLTCVLNVLCQSGGWLSVPSLLFFSDDDDDDERKSYKEEPLPSHAPAGQSGTGTRTKGGCVRQGVIVHVNFTFLRFLLFSFSQPPHKLFMFSCALVRNFSCHFFLRENFPRGIMLRVRCFFLPQVDCGGASYLFAATSSVVNQQGIHLLWLV